MPSALASLRRGRHPGRTTARDTSPRRPPPPVRAVVCLGRGQCAPPVVLRSQASQAQWNAGWQPYLERLSLACVEMVLSESLFAAPLELGDNRELDAAAVALEMVRATLPGDWLMAPA